MSAPYYIAWNYNYACNFNCTHCYSRAPWYPEELGTAAYRQIADEIADMGVFRVALGGGEPLLRPDSIEILERLSRRGVETNLTTNGWRFDSSTATALKDSGLTRLYVSVDSDTAAEHDRFRRQIGSFDKVIRSASLAVEAGIDVFFSTVLVKDTYSRIEGISNLAHSVGVAGVEFKRFRPAGNGAQFEHLYALTLQQRESLLPNFRTLQRSAAVEVSLINGPESNIMSTESIGCACGVKSICLRPNGDVSPCAYSDVVVGNIQTRSLKDIWSSSDVLTELRRSGGCQAIAPTAYPTNPTALTYSTRREARAHSPTDLP
jgi:MoaA/NifB/PqqE/SkfB family radical SAM enzyme